MYYTIKDYYRKICRIINYIPVLWKIYDFDHSSALEVFRHQLSRIYVSMENGHEDPKSLKVKLRKLKTLIEVCDRLNNDFEEDAWDIYLKKYPDRFTNFTEAISKPQPPEYKRDLKNLIHYEKVRKAMYKRLFIKIFERNFESFWD
jgi:hypothetical protein